MKNKPSQHHIDTLAALLLFGVFAVCVLTVLLTGADAYGRVIRRDGEASDCRARAQYVATRVRQADAAGGVRLERFGDTTALVLRDGGEGDYVTRVYCWEGWLMELYSEAGLDLAPGDGEKIMACGWMDLSLTGGLLTVDLPGARGEAVTLRLSLRSGEGGEA